MHIYQSHLGGIYATTEYLDDLYCETCGDSDWYIGEYNSAVTFLKDEADDIDTYDGHGGYALEGVLSALCAFDDCPSEEDAIRIVKEHRRCEDQY